MFTLESCAVKTLLIFMSIKSFRVKADADQLKAKGITWPLPSNPCCSGKVSTELRGRCFCAVRLWKRGAVEGWTLTGWVSGFWTIKPWCMTGAQDSEGVSCHMVLSGPGGQCRLDKVQKCSLLGAASEESCQQKRFFQNTGKLSYWLMLDIHFFR